MVPIRYNIRSLLVRKRTSVAAAAGIGLAVFIFAGAQMLTEGINNTLNKSGTEGTAIVLRKGSQAELESMIEEERVGLVLAAPGVRKKPSGGVDGVGEIIVVTSLDKVGAQGISNVTIRGITEGGVDFRPSVRVVEGRPPKLGAPEVMVGQRIRGRFKGLDLGQSFELKKNLNVAVVGIFEDGGSAYESEAWADIDLVRTGFRREGMVSSIRVRLESPEKLDAFKTAIESDKQLGLDVRSEPDYYQRQSFEIGIFFTVLGLVFAVFLSFGAMIGAMITMYAAVSNRSREIGTLQALGFSRFSILVSFLIEAIVLALVGGAVGAVLSLSMGFLKFSTMNWVSFSEVVFSFNPTPEIIVSALIFACGMGLLGGFLPAVRAARMSPLAAIRD
jgi:putative ABC transport system permease protein